MSAAPTADTPSDPTGGLIIATKMAYDWLREWGKTNKLYNSSGTGKFNRPPNKYSIPGISTSKYNYARRRYFRKWRRSKYIFNYFNLKYDFIVTVEFDSTIQGFVFKNGSNVISQDQIYCGFNMLAPFFNSYSGSKQSFQFLRNIFDQIKLNGVAVRYKPYTLTNVNNYIGDFKPNLLMTILTQNEYEQLNWSATDSQADINFLNERPYTKYGSFDDDMRIYRPFRFKKELKEDNENNNLFYYYMDITDQIGYAVLYFYMRFSQQLSTAPTTNMKFGELNYSLYFKFRHNSI